MKATHIEFRSNVDGLDLIEISWRRGVQQQLRDVKLAFMRAGYRVFGEIFMQDMEWHGEMVAKNNSEEVRFHIV
jgi:hypothetical protein